MSTLTMKCEVCRRMHISWSPRQGRQGIVQIAAWVTEAGWHPGSTPGKFVCSEDCKAMIAKDVTPKIKFLSIPQQQPEAE